MRPLALAVFLAASGCANGNGAVTDTASVPEAADAGDDWVVLFDGETLDGWTGYNRDDAPAGWSVEDGTIRFTPGREGGDLMVDGTYDDFELELEWRVAECGNSGIFYRGEVSPDFDVPWRTALEMQVLDDACHPDARYPSHRAGALYDLYVPSDLSAVRPAGEWNRVRIVADGSRIEHWLNGVQVVEAEQASADWDARVAASKFRDGEAFPAFGSRLGGGIGVQDHGDSVWYRNVRIRTL